MTREHRAKSIGLAIVGAGRIGLIRGEIAARLSARRRQPVRLPITPEDERR